MVVRDFLYHCILFYSCSYYFLKTKSTDANFITLPCCHFCLLSPIGHSCDRLHERVCLWIAGLQYLFLSFSVLQVLFPNLLGNLWEVKVQSLCTNDSIIRCLSVISSIDSFGKSFGKSFRKSLSFFPSFLPPSSSSLPIETR